MILCFRFGELPMGRQPFADVVETFFGHSLKPTNEPHTADTLKDILGPVRKERQGAPCEHGRRVRRAGRRRRAGQDQDRDRRQEVRRRHQVRPLP